MLLSSSPSTPRRMKAPRSSTTSMSVCPSSLMDRFSLVLDVGTLEHIFRLSNRDSQLHANGGTGRPSPTRNASQQRGGPRVLSIQSRAALSRSLHPSYGFRIEQMLLMELGARGDGGGIRSPTRPSWEAGHSSEVGHRRIYSSARPPSGPGTYVRPAPPTAERLCAAQWQDKPPQQAPTGLEKSLSWAVKRLPWSKQAYLNLRPARRALFMRREYRKLPSHFQPVSGPSHHSTLDDS